MWVKNWHIFDPRYAQETPKTQKEMHLWPAQAFNKIDDQRHSCIRQNVD
jgi:hypothetical protein